MDMNYHLHGPFVGETDECNFNLDERSGARMHWSKGDFPITFYIHESLSQEPHAASNFKSAVNHWNSRWYHFLQSQNITPFQLIQVAEGYRSGEPREDGNNMIFLINDDFSPHANNGGMASGNTQAITTTLYEPGKGKIIEADIKVNNTGDFKYFYDPSYDRNVMAFQKSLLGERSLASSYAKDPPKNLIFWFKFQVFKFVSFFKKKPHYRGLANVPSNMVDFPSLMIHEIGHVPGLAHTKHQSKGAHYDSVMERLLADGRMRRAITQNDLQDMLCGYYDL